MRRWLSNREELPHGTTYEAQFNRVVRSGKSNEAPRMIPIGTFTVWLEPKGRKESLPRTATREDKLWDQERRLGIKLEPWKVDKYDPQLPALLPAITTVVIAGLRLVAAGMSG